MPKYSFQDSNTGEVFDQMMKIAEKETFLADNPHLTQVITQAPSLGDSIRLGVRKSDSGWNDLMSRIGDANPRSEIANKYKRRTAKEVKTDAALKKRGFGGDD